MALVSAHLLPEAMAVLAAVAVGAVLEELEILQVQLLHKGQMVALALPPVAAVVVAAQVPQDKPEVHQQMEVAALELPRLFLVVLSLMQEAAAQAAQ